MFANLKICQKIYALGFIQVGLLLAVVVVAIVQMNKIGVELVDIAERDIPLTGKITQITEHQLQQAIVFERLLFSVALNASDQSELHSNLSPLIAYLKQLDQKLNDEVSDAISFAASAAENMHSKEVKAEFLKVQNALRDIQNRTSQFSAELKKIVEQVDSIPLSQLAKKGHELEALDDEIQRELTTLLHEVQEFTLAASLQAESDEQAGILLIAIVGVIALLIGAFLPFVIGRSITNPIKLLSSRLTEIAVGDGDLTVRLNDNSKDETGDVARAFNKFLDTLRVLIGTTNSHADELGRSSEIAMKSMRETLTNVEQQRIETEMVAAAVNEMSSTTQDVAKSAANAAEVTQQVTSKVNEGKKVAADTQLLIKQLSEEVGEASKVIKGLVEETNNIGNVLESIQGIAAQTNLLALNAAIEAARAGESGRGFAVVADEVRTLAQRTQNSTVDIQELLTRLKTEANNAVTSMNKGSESANSCLEYIAKTSQTFEEASHSVLQISDLNITIATAAEEQSSVAEEVNKNLHRISTLAEITAEGARATSDANTTIAKRVIDLHANLNKFLV
uniref:Methyl-accepting chemotaxis protein I (Serine chemoreceptor protein) n=1 Tax=Rheinheimera sp. BAL341 TaxID=1708203 RepID=A0A486XUJ2_9GAMM